MWTFDKTGSAVAVFLALILGALTLSATAARAEWVVCAAADDQNPWLVRLTCSPPLELEPAEGLRGCEERGFSHGWRFRHRSTARHHVERSCASILISDDLP